MFYRQDCGRCLSGPGVLRRGGFGIVYLACDTATSRQVAVNVPLGEFVDDPAVRKRLARGAEVWCGLICPHIVHPFDVRDDKTTDYRPAVVMDYCDGGSLADRLRRGPRLPLSEALDIVIQVCWAMAYAHEFEYDVEGRRVQGGTVT